MDCFPLCWEVSRVIEKAKFGKAKRSLAGVCLARKGLRHRRIEP